MFLVNLWVIVVMPFLQFFTTLSANKVPKDFPQRTAQLLTQVLRDKPMDRIAVHLATDQHIFSGKKLLCVSN